jgi:hypothetical protein
MLQRTPAHLLAPRRNTLSRSALTRRFRNAWKMGVSGIIQAGQVLLDGKEQLAHGEWLGWLHKDLKLHERRAQMLMLVASHPVLSNANHASHLPASWTTLYALSFLCRPGQSPQKMLGLIKSGAIHPTMTREEATALLPGRQQGSPPLILSADLARIQRVLGKLSIEQTISNLRTDPGSSSPESLRKLGRKLVAIATRWQQMD